ncbi:MAG: sigma-54-dependent Fis family transcriptional regulator [Candidatus Marinimicrobia bacterium]|nr:sigma-54-dependent Fis family transcriptional regulator [Candidatus Neomarinimicrobiota bacterium]
MKVLPETKLEILQKKYGLIGISEKIKDVVRMIEQVGPTDISVLIEGESGTGKELVAKAIHGASSRHDKPLVVVNAGAIPEGLIESELFGHVKGAFTGAVADRKGYFEEANGGTIFLDEIGEMPLNTQVRLLRILEQKEYQRVGNAESKKLDVRVIAATNRKLPELIQSGLFRRDLYFRLKSITIVLPSLRSRKEDIEMLAQIFSTARASNLNITFGGFTEEAIDILNTYHWPGNIRELKNLMESLVVLEKGKVITGSLMKNHLQVQGEDLNFTSQNLPVPLDKDPATAERELIIRTLFHMNNEISEIKNLLTDKFMLPAGYINSKSDDVIRSSKVNDAPIIHSDEEVGTVSMQDMEKELIISTLEKYRGNRRMTSNALGISERTLYRKIKEYDI